MKRKGKGGGGGRKEGRHLPAEAARRWWRPTRHGGEKGHTTRMRRGSHVKVQPRLRGAGIHVARQPLGQLRDNVGGVAASIGLIVPPDRVGVGGQDLVPSDGLEAGHVAQGVGAGADSEGTNGHRGEGASVKEGGERLRGSAVGGVIHVGAGEGAVQGNLSGQADGGGGRLQLRRWYDGLLDRRCENQRKGRQKEGTC